MRRPRPVLLIIDSCFERARRLGVALALVLDFDTAFASDGREALARALDEKPRAVFVDIDADLGGIDVASSILLQMDRQAPALIALVDEGNLLRVAQSGLFLHALVKPVDEQRAAALLRSL